MAHNPRLSTYLNDHLAGSAAVIDLLTNVAASYAGTDVQRFASELAAEVTADRGELEGLMLLEGERSARRQAAGGSRKARHLKLRVDDPAAGALRLLEAVEAISLGVEGSASVLLLRRRRRCARTRRDRLRAVDPPLSRTTPQRIEGGVP